MQQGKHGYVALAVAPDTSVNANAVTVHPNGDVTVYTRDLALLDNASKAGFRFDPLPSDRPRNAHGFRLKKPMLASMQQHEAIFSQLVVESLRLITDRYATQQQRRSPKLTSTGIEHPLR